VGLGWERRGGLIVHMLLTLSLATGLTRRPAPAEPYRGLTRSAILRLLKDAHEVGTWGEHLALMGRIVTVSDGHGGTLTAVPAVRSPTANGDGQPVLFWHDRGRTLLSRRRSSRDWWHRISPSTG
jgi:hypothetical protein